MTADSRADLFRLPRSVAPNRYEIRLEPDLEAFTFSGEETVAVTVREPVAEIVLNAAALQVHQASIGNGEGVTLTGTAAL